MRWLKPVDMTRPHVKFVTGLALQIFDELNDLHHLGNKERFWLICAGILHSIGWVEGGKNHAKKSTGNYFKYFASPLKKQRTSHYWINRQIPLWGKPEY